MTTTNDVQEIAQLAAAQQQVQTMGDGMPALILPSDYRVEKLESTLLRPLRKRGAMGLNDAESFIAVVKEQKTADTRLFSTIDPPSFLAVFNHNAQEAGWGDHRAAYNAPLSPEWLAWKGFDCRKVSQVDLAQFIENNLIDVADPDGATLLEICRTLEAKKKVKFSSAVRLSDGSQQFTYDEDVQGTAQRGQLKVPEQFVIGIPVFENGDKWRMDVRLRYRIVDGGVLTMWIELIRPHKVMEEAIKELRLKISAETELAIWNGTPSK